MRRLLSGNFDKDRREKISHQPPTITKDNLTGRVVPSSIPK